MSPSDLTTGRRPLPRDHKDYSSEPSYFLQLSWDAFESIRFGALMDCKKRSVFLKALQSEERSHIDAVQMHPSVDRFALEEEVLRKEC